MNPSDSAYKARRFTQKNDDQMKKMRQYLTLIAAALLVTACSSDSLTDDKDDKGFEMPQLSDNPIRFSVADSVAGTRAVNEISAFNAGSEIGVFASYTGNLKYHLTTVSSNYMYNQKVTLSTSGNWEYEPIKYWPNNTDEYISFFAYAPYEGTPSNTTCVMGFSPKDEKGDPWLVYQLAADPAYQVDLLYGVNNAETPTPWYDQQKPAVGDKLKFYFKHALACVGDVINIKISDALNEKLGNRNYAKVYINKLTIKYTNLTEKAKLVLNSSADPNWMAVVSGMITTTRTVTVPMSGVPDALRGTTKTSAAEYQAYFTANSGITDSGTEISSGKGLFYIPLQVEPDPAQAVITLDYQVINNAGSSYTGSASTSFDLNLNNVGKKQGITITLTENFNLLHNVYILGSGATEPSYSR